MTSNRRWFVWRGVATIALLGALVVGGFAVYRLGWSQGFGAAQLMAEDENVPSPWTSPAQRPVDLSPGGFLITVLVGWLLLAFAGRLLHFVAWGTVAGPAMQRHAMCGNWRHPWYDRRGPGPSWQRPRYDESGTSTRIGDEQANAGA